MDGNRFPRNNLFKIVIVSFIFSFWCLSVSFGIWVGENVGEERFEKRAIEKGYAEYYIDEGFNKQWRWKNDNETKN